MGLRDQVQHSVGNVLVCERRWYTWQEEMFSDNYITITALRLKEMVASY
jgi:hypothetical protein